MLTPTEKIWHNGRFIKWEEATIHVLSHVVSYGSSVFEGIRCYSTPSGPAVFRLREHVRDTLDVGQGQDLDGVRVIGADSLDQVELVMALEENFDIEIPDDAAEKIRTVQDAIDYIDKHSKVSK